VKGGALISAIQEERLTRIKNQGGLPELALETLQADLGPADPEVEFSVGYGWKELRRYCWKREDMLEAYGHSRPSLINKVKAGLRKLEPIAEALDSRRAGKVESRVGTILNVPRLKLHRFDHHLCHAAAAYFGWGKLDEKVLVLTCDGAGDGICASVSLGHKGELQRIASIADDSSIGRLYSTITYLFGMVPLEHEYKIMGLAPYSEHAAESRNLAEAFNGLFRFNRDNRMVWTRRGCPPAQQSTDFFERFIARKRFDHVAGGLQVFLERFLVQWIRNCIAETGVKKLALSGGVFMNVKANQRILEIPEVEELFVFPSCGDETNAIGSAWLLYDRLVGRPPEPLRDLYLGESFSNHDVEHVLSNYHFEMRVKIENPPDIESRVAELLSRGEIVARFKGRMEFGARALGNRSILANAAFSGVVRTINEMIKCRDFWMPFAPSMLSERRGDYLIKPKDMKAPYMIVTFDTKPGKRSAIAAAMHPYDLTARPQEVNEDWNPDYYRLLKCFEEITGEGVILNTSFNLHGEPVVCSPEDALRVFSISGLQYLALESFLVTKQ